MLEVTTDLPPLSYDPPKTISEILSRGGSEVGNSAVAAWLTCPEYSRLRAAGVTRKQKAKTIEGLIEPLGDADFGSVYHALSATRTAGNMEFALHYLEHTLKPQLAAEDFNMLFHCLKVNDAAYPLEEDEKQFEVIGVETLVCSDVKNTDGSELIRTVIYDKIIALRSDMRGRGVYSLEVKTGAKHGESALQKYRLQRTAQPAIWNSNAALVGRYGPMHGVIFEQIAKTTIPQCERFGPYYTSKMHERLYLDYTRGPETIHFPVGRDGSYPKMLHSCFSRYGWCTYERLCWDNCTGDYSWP